MIDGYIAIGKAESSRRLIFCDHKKATARASERSSAPELNVQEMNFEAF